MRDDYESPSAGTPGAEHLRDALEKITRWMPAGRQKRYCQYNVAAAIAILSGVANWSVCVECSREFTYDRDNFILKGLQPPKRCLECRLARKGAAGC